MKGLATMVDRKKARGRKPMGAKLAQHLEGSSLAKQRLEGILATITGELSIPEACQQLGISEARLYQLRTEVLEAALSCLEPRPAGRPPRVESAESQQVAQLKGQLEDAQWELKAVEVRAVVAEAMPNVSNREEVKKTNDRTARLKRSRHKRKPSRTRPR
jgi:hypothetical protein